MRRPAAAALCLLALSALAGCGSRVELPAAASTPADAPPSVAVTPSAGPKPAPDPVETPPAAPATSPEPSSGPPPGQTVQQPTTDDPGAALWGRSFVSSTVEEEGRPGALVDGTVVRVTFERSGGTGTLRWNAGCNTTGGKVRVTPTVLDVEPEGSTAAGCDDARHAQDGWITEFFRGDPQWELTDAVLTLRRGGTVIRLQESHD